MKEYYLLGGTAIHFWHDKGSEKAASAIENGGGDLCVYTGNLGDLLDEVSFWGTYEKISEEAFHEINEKLDDDNRLLVE